MRWREKENNFERCYTEDTRSWRWPWQARCCRKKSSLDVPRLLLQSFGVSRIRVCLERPRLGPSPIVRFINFIRQQRLGWQRKMSGGREVIFLYISPSSRLFRGEAKLSSEKTNISKRKSPQKCPQIHFGVTSTVERETACLKSTERISSAEKILVAQDSVAIQWNISDVRREFSPLLIAKWLDRRWNEQVKPFATL